MDSILRFARDAREKLMPQLRSSHFESMGILTAVEFVTAGDNLVGKYPAWQWGTTLDPNLRKVYLPTDKQFLVLRGAPCAHRVSDLNPEDWEDEWHAVDGESAKACGEGDDPESHEDDQDYKWARGEKEPAQGSSERAEGQEEKSEADLKNLLFDLEEDASIFGTFTDFSQISVPPSFEQRPRKYDISIVYDNFYRVPKVFLFGYDESGSALSHQQMLRDVISDYVRKTVTIEPHPLLQTHMLSVHPCKHGSAMLRLIQAQKELGRQVTVDSYLFLFLKFIQSVVPTIEYDHHNCSSNFGY